MSCPKKIFILSGQSNMSGRGGVINKKWNGVVPTEATKNETKIFRFSADNKWEVAGEPLHADIDTAKVCGLGPGMCFANCILSTNFDIKSLKEEDDRVVLGLVPCAIGGTALKEWGKGCKLYENMIRRAKEAVGDDGEGGEIMAVLWYQGESDTYSHYDSQAYGHNLRELIENVRSDLELPELPFIQVALASGHHKYLEKVREAQLGLKMHNVLCVDAKGLALNADNLHLTTESQVLLGGMMAKAYSSSFLAAPTN